jgi:hypothetical protein
MNAVLAKPIHAIWFIQARAVDLDQSLAAALFVSLPSWLRDHPSLPGSGRKIAATHNQKISARGAFADQRKHHPTDIELQLRNFARGVLECSAPADKSM